jgi:hypothetical protein
MLFSFVAIVKFMMELGQPGIRVAPHCRYRFVIDPRLGFSKSDVISPFRRFPMFVSRRHLVGLSVGLLSVAMLFGSVGFQSFRTDAADAKDSKLKQLMREKLRILEEDAIHLEELHKKAEAGYEELYEAQRDMRRAQLDLCETDKERITILEKLLVEAKHREDSVAELKGAAKTPIGMHKAIIERLNVEIELGRLKSK